MALQVCLAQVTGSYWMGGRSGLSFSGVYKVARGTTILQSSVKDPEIFPPDPAQKKKSVPDSTFIHNEKKIFMYYVGIYPLFQVGSGSDEKSTGSRHFW